MLLVLGLAIVLDVPFVAQEKNGCGAAVIAMSTQYWRGPASTDVRLIQRSLYNRQARGIYASELEGYLRRSGFRTFAISGEWNDIEHHLGKGRPLIVALKPGLGDLHYVVVTGIDSEQGIVLKHDPARRQLMKQQRSEFEQQWKAAGNWTLLALSAE